jgi:flagellar biosynthetic protein FliO
MEWILVKTLLSLFAVLGLMIAVLALVRRLYRSGSTTPGSGVSIELLARTTIQPKCSVAVIKVLDRILVVGATEQQVNLLSEMDESETRPAFDGADPESAAAGMGHGNFLNNLNRYLRMFRIQAFGSGNGGNHNGSGEKYQ